MRLTVTKDNVDKHIKELQDDVKRSSLNFDIWWIYKERRVRNKYEHVFNHYGWFFDASLHAHFVAMIMALYKLYERRNDTFNIAGFIALLKRGKFFTPKTLALLKQKQNTILPLWNKVAILRNNLLGHRSLKKKSSDVFKDAQIKPRDLRNLICMTKKLLNEASQAWDRRTLCDVTAKHDTIRLLDALKANNSE